MAQHTSTVLRKGITSLTFQHDRATPGTLLETLQGEVLTTRVCV